MKYRKDLALIAVVLAAALLMWLYSQLSASTDVTTVVAFADGKEVLRRPLLMNAEYEIPNAEGLVNIICVDNGEVFMRDANCRDGLCIRQGRMKN
ncbi:MAG: NusG domain II-containing protein, partial [Clostridia bacterium]|nr:NusG domain II-containing protein [Clostridia bacterium]